MKSIKHILLSLIILISTGIMAQTHSFKTDQAEIKWTGKKVGGSHWGYIKLKEGHLVMKDHKITSGTFTIDMKSISNVDVENKKYNKKLIDHLNSDDFFGVKDFPKAVLEITDSTPFENHEAYVKGKLTIKGITNPVEFKIKYDDHKLFASITVDRSQYNVRYGSKSFFDNLGDKMIYDDFTLDVTLLLGEH